MSDPQKLTGQRILFVDDNSDVLGALKVSLRKMRHEWDMVFVSSGAEALAEFARSPFDVVISDMQMPGMDGARLLSEVRDKYPGAARIILSGHAEPTGLSRGVPVAHQFMSKPCATGTLRAVIGRAFAQRRLLEDPALRALLGQIDHLPSAPAILARLARAIEDPNADVADIAAIVEQDPASAAKILQLANSSYFGAAAEVNSIAAAIVLLGLQLLRGVVLSAHMFSLGARVLDSAFLDRMQRGAIASARIARRLVGEPKQAEQAFTAALLHDIGQIILASGFPERYGIVLPQYSRPAGEFLALERATVGATHAQLGGYLLGLWGLPVSIVEAVALHEEPAIDTVTNSLLIGAVHFASRCTDAVQSGAGLEEAALDLAFLERAGLATLLEDWTSIAKEELKALSPL